MKKSSIILFIILAIVGMLILNSKTIAKYISESFWEYQLRSDSFYFGSDYLEETVIHNINSFWDGTSVDFNVRNNLNQTVISNDNIEYNILCTIEGAAASYSECRLDGTLSNEASSTLLAAFACVNTTGDQVDVSAYDENNCTLGGYDWLAQIVTNDHYFDVVLTNGSYEIEDVLVTLEVTSTSPYEKIITGDFTLHKTDFVEDTINITYENLTNYDKLTISNLYTIDKCVNITWDSANIRIDAESSEFSYYDTDLSDYINEIELTIPDKESTSFTFYPTDLSATYDETAFTVSETCNN